MKKSNFKGIHSKCGKLFGKTTKQISILLQNIDPLFDLILKQCSKKKTITVTWDSELKRMSALDDETLNKRRRKSFCFNIAAVLIMVQIVVHGYVVPATKSEDDIFIKILTAYVLISLPAHMGFEKVSNHRTSELSPFLTGLYAVKPDGESFNQQVPLNANPLLKMFMVFAWGLFLFFRAVPPMMIFGFHWKNPCRPIILAWWTLPECYSDGVNQPDRNIAVNVGMQLLKIPVLYVSYLIYNHGYMCCNFGMVAMNILTILKLHQHLKILAKSIERNEIGTCFTHGLAYRKMQLLTNLYNLIMQTAFLTIVTAALFCLSLSITVLVQIELSSRNVLAFVFFSWLGLESILFFTVGIGGPMVSMHVDSKQLLTNFKRQHGNVQKSVGTAEQRLSKIWINKFYRSCSPIKIKLGESNFLEELTPLRCVDCSFDMTIQFLLLT
ncbi:unnamed protein product [Orchesella dallaii]|uniref:Odorant receptor n=1 Tax=Orchesella dallaii TaxID=48710 RepID=A0ABP1PJU3_9HEXA